MKKNINTLLIFFLPLFAGESTFALSGSGSGTLEDSYLVSSAAQLAEVANDFTDYYKQTADIDISGFPNWTRIGKSTPAGDNFTDIPANDFGPTERIMKAYFDGTGHYTSI